jgi:hypothetical protein
MTKHVCIVELGHNSTLPLVLEFNLGLSLGKTLRVYDARSFSSRLGKQRRANNHPPASRKRQQILKAITVIDWAVIRERQIAIRSIFQQPIVTVQDHVIFIDQRDNRRKAIAVGIQCQIFARCSELTVDPVAPIFANASIVDARSAMRLAGGRTAIGALHVKGTGIDKGTVSLAVHSPRNLPSSSDVESNGLLRQNVVRTRIISVVSSQAPRVLLPAITNQKA